MRHGTELIPAVFTLPTVYAAKQKEVDAMLATATTHYTNLNAKLVALVPKQQEAQAAAKAASLPAAWSGPSAL